MSKDVYDSASPIPAKLLNSDGSVTDFNNNEILPPSEKRKEIYSQSGYIVNKCLNPDGTIGTLPNGGGGGTTDYNNLSNKPTLYGKTLQGNQLPEYYGCADLTKFNDLEAHVEVIDASQSSITIEEEFNTIQELADWLTIPANYQRVRNGTIFIIKDPDTPNQKAKWDGNKWIFTDIEPLNANKVVYKNTTVADEFEAVADEFVSLDDKINNIVINSVVMPQGQIYLSAGGGTANGTFSLTEPATTQTFPTLVSTTPTLRNIFSYVFTQAGFVSSLSTWQFLLKLQNLSAQTDYVISASIVLIRAGQPDFVLSQLTNFQFETGNQQTAMNIILPFLSNNISDATAKLNYALGDRLEVRLTWNKANGGQQTINIVSTATNPCTFIRNGGEVGSTLVIDNNGVNTQSQAQRNRTYDRIATVCPSDSVIKADVINKTGSVVTGMDLVNKEFTCPSAGEFRIRYTIQPARGNIAIVKNGFLFFMDNYKFYEGAGGAIVRDFVTNVNKGDVIKLEELTLCSINGQFFGLLI